MLDKKIIQYCSPTLAGLKIGGMFGYSFNSYELFRAEYANINKILKSKGVELEILELKANRALLYVYRPKMLSKKLEEGCVKCLMSEIGYENTGVEYCIDFLRSRLMENGEFPHEVGVFLGYPVEDVVGFIENCGLSCKLCGIWKVYGDVDVATNLFKKFKKCESVYKKRFSENYDLAKLTICA